MKMRKKTFFLLCLLQITTPIFSQKEVGTIKRIHILTINNQEFIKYIDSVSNEESKYLGENDMRKRGYLIDYTAFYYDTTVLINSLYPSDYDTILEDTIYGIFTRNNHLVFVKREMGVNFTQSDSTAIFTERKNKPYFDLVFDDSVSFWCFSLKNGKLNYKFKSSHFFDYEPLIKIEIIEDEIEEFPL